MNRRDLFKRLAGAIAATGTGPLASAEAHEAPCDPARALVVLKSDRILSNMERRNLSELWLKTVHGTPWQGARAVVLDRELQLEVHDIARFGVQR